MNIVRAWGIGLAAAAIGLAALQVPAAVAAENTRAKISFNIEAQPIGDALNAFASQSGLQVLYLSKLGRDVTAPRVRGSLTPEEALQQLLGASGLKYEFINPRTITVRTATAAVAETPASERAEVPRTQREDASPIRLTRVSSGAISQDEGGSAAAAAAVSHEPGSISGRITESQTGSSLVGALVRIEETGQQASTDDLGYFRFPSVRPGRYTLYISYLGYPERRESFTLGGKDALQADIRMGREERELGTIEVFGSSSARAQALNQQRTAENSSEVVSADMLGDFTGTTISEAMRRMSGIAFERDFHTGDGVNITIRGMSPDFNQIKLNGLNLPVGSGTGRAPALNNILADSISKITVHKTLLPSHESAGIGGLVEIETKAPLDRPRNYMNFAFEGGRKGGDFGDDTLMSGTVSHTFGERGIFGLSASVQYREREARSMEYYAGSPVWGLYLPLDASGQPTITSHSALDPRTVFPFVPGVDQVYVNSYSSSRDDLVTQTMTSTVSGQLKFLEYTSLRLDASRSEAVTDRVSLTNNFDGTPVYQLRPVVALGGQQRQAVGWNGGVSVGQGYQVINDQNMTTDTLSLQGVTEVNKWKFSYTLGAARGTTDSPSQYRLSFGFQTDATSPFLASYISPQAVDPVEGRIISVFPQRQGRGYIVPYLTDAGYQFLASPANYRLQSGSINASEGSNDRKTANFSSRYDFSRQHLKYVEVGMQSERARFSSDSTGVSYMPRFITNPCCSQGVITMSSLGLAFVESDLGAISQEGGTFYRVAADMIEPFIMTMPSIAAAPGSTLQANNFTRNPLQGRQFTRESNLATFLQARIDFGKLEIVGGARVNTIDVNSVVFTGPKFTNAQRMSDPVFEAQYAQLLNLTAQQMEVLPRVSFNYRQTDNLIFRAGYYMAIARPQINQLSQVKQVTLSLAPSPFPGPGQGRPSLNVSEGNPDLKPAVTNAFDLSGEYYHDQIGVLRFSAYLKLISNLMETNTLEGIDQLDDVELPDHPYFQNLPANLYITGQKPVNSEYGARSWGFEAALERRFTFLPGIFSGLGIYSNVSYADSSKVEFITWGQNATPVRIKYSDVPLNAQPKYTGTMALTYNKYDIDATLAYTAQARARQFSSSYGIHSYTEGLATLDFRAAYYLRGGLGNYRVFFEASNLLAGPADPDMEFTLGGDGAVPRIYYSGNFQGGRQLKIGVSGSF